MELIYSDITDYWQEIDSGSFGKVFKADYLGTEVAIKEFLDLTQEPTFDLKKYIDREIGILIEARHPQVVQFMGVCVHENKCLIVTEFVNGGNLKDFIQNNSEITMRTKINFAIDCARALVYLHAKGIIHRDLKSENLLLTENKRIKVCDFGLSRVSPKTKEEFLRLSFCGTETYMSPEVMLCIPFGESVDVFSFGIIMLELILQIVADTTIKTGQFSSHPLFERVIPGFGFHIDKLTEAAPKDCPAEFLELALDCVQDSPDRRPLMKEVLKRMKAIEKKLEFGTADGNAGIITSSEIKLFVSESAELNTSGKYDPPRSLSIQGIHNSSRDIEQLVALDRVNPHRFSLIYMNVGKKCVVCTRGFGITHRRHLICDDCGVQVHKKCSLFCLPNCGGGENLSGKNIIEKISKSMSNLAGGKDFIAK